MIKGEEMGMAVVNEHNDQLGLVQQPFLSEILFQPRSNLKSS
jgi:hypothetical protein